MKVLTLALMFSLSMFSLPMFSLPTSSLSVAPWAPPKPLRQPTTAISKHSKGGRWYFAASGHAVYCYGPVMTLPSPNGDIQKVATFCRDGSAVVPLKD
jgi:hypothetical protein